MNEIVVGVDGSRGGQEALRWALAEARLRGATLRVVKAWIVPYVEAIPEPWVLGINPPGPPIVQVHEGFRQEAEKILESSAREAVEAGDVEVEVELVEGRPANKLLEAARDADLLVVGTRGRGGFAGLLLGSVSQQCAHHAPCPLVIVPTPEDER